MKFNFKSTGYKIDDKKFKLTSQQKQSLKSVPIGIKTPLQFGEKNVRLFEMHYNPVDQIKDNLKNLLQTNAGERLGRHNYGASLSALLFERVSLNQEFETVATKQILDQVKRYIPILQIDNVNYSVDKKVLNDTTSLAKITIMIDFSVPRLQLTNQKTEIVLYVGG